MPLWTRKLRSQQASPAETMNHVSEATESLPAILWPAEHNRINPRILQLPGELRNLIYHFAIYPRLNHIQIMPNRDYLQGHKNSQSPVLNLPVFHISHQIRVEALSFLCANKELRILGLDAANAFFEVAGGAISDIKRVVLSQPVCKDFSSDVERLDTFFRLLGNAAALQHFKLVVTMTRLPVGWDKGLRDSDWVFLERLMVFAAGRDDLEFKWATGAYARHTRQRGGGFGGSKRFKELLGEENEVEEWRCSGGRHKHGYAF
jgi:hypothetical protein